MQFPIKIIYAVHSKLLQINDCSFSYKSNISIMLYSSEYQIIKYFSVILCQNTVPQNKMKQWK